MIHLLSKRYQVLLWESQDRSSEIPALRFDSDDLEEARTWFEAHRAEGRYRTGIFYEWRQASGSSHLIDRF